MTEQKKDAPIPTEVRLTDEGLVLNYEDKEPVSFPHRFLRRASPAAVDTLFPHYEQKVPIVAVEPVGRYAINLRFSDGHQSGIYDWEYLNWLSEEQERLNAEWENGKIDDSPFALYAQHWTGCQKKQQRKDRQ